MKTFKPKAFIFAITMAIVLILGLLVNQFLIVAKAHSTLGNYYAFRGCVKLIKKTENYAVCKISSGKIIKIVKVKNKWYLDHDLPNWL